MRFIIGPSADHAQGMTLDEAWQTYGPPELKAEIAQLEAASYPSGPLIFNGITYQLNLSPSEQTRYYSLALRRLEWLRQTIAAGKLVADGLIPQAGLAAPRTSIHPDSAPLIDGADFLNSEITGGHVTFVYVRLRVPSDRRPGPVLNGDTALNEAAAQQAPIPNKKRRPPNSRRIETDWKFVDCMAEAIRPGSARGPEDAARMFADGARNAAKGAKFSQKEEGDSVVKRLLGKYARVYDKAGKAAQPEY